MGLLSLFSKIKSFFNKNITEEELKHNDFVENVIPSLKFGDIIYAERFINDIEKKQMGEGHNTGPFVVISFDEDKIIGAYCTSTETVRGGFEIGEGYELFHRNKKTYATVFYMRTIDYEAYLHNASQHLNINDINKLKKKICLTNKIQYDDFGLLKDLETDINIDYEIGDIVTCGGPTYIIVEKNDDDKFIIMPIKKCNPHHSYIDFSKVRIDYSNTKEVEKKDLYYLNSVNQAQMIVIMNNYNNYKKMKDEIINKKAKKLDRGCLINAFNNLYYVYGIEGNIANTFVVKKTSSCKKYVVITGEKYIPLYEKTNDIDIKSDTYTIIGLASEKEMDYIKEAKKNYKKTKKEEEARKNIKIIKQPKKNNKNKLSIGTIVCLKNDITSKYIICNEENNIYDLISLPQLLFEEEIVNIKLPKYSVRKVNNITSIELKIIKRKLEELGNKELSNEIAKNIIM